MCNVPPPGEAGFAAGRRKGVPAHTTPRGEVAGAHVARLASELRQSAARRLRARRLEPLTADELDAVQELVDTILKLFRAT